MEHFDGIVLIAPPTRRASTPTRRAARRAGVAATLAQLHARRPRRGRPRRLPAAREPDQPAAAPLAAAVGRVEDPRPRRHRRARRVARGSGCRTSTRPCSLHGDYHLAQLRRRRGRRRPRGARLGALHGRRPARRRRPDGRVLERAAQPRTGFFREPVAALAGFPDAGALAGASTREASGRDVDDLGYWVAFAYWKIAIIVEGVYRRWLNDPQNGSDAGRSPRPSSAWPRSRARRRPSTAGKYLTAELSERTAVGDRTRPRGRETAAAAAAEAGRQEGADPRGRDRLLRTRRLRGDEVGGRRRCGRHRLDRAVPLLRVEAALPLRDHGPDDRATSASASTGSSPSTTTGPRRSSPCSSTRSTSTSSRCCASG